MSNHEDMLTTQPITYLQLKCTKLTIHSIVLCNTLYKLYILSSTIILFNSVATANMLYLAYLAKAHFIA